MEGFTYKFCVSFITSACAIVSVWGQNLLLYKGQFCCQGDYNDKLSRNMWSVIALVVVVGLVYAQEPPCCTGKQWEANEYYQLGTVEGGQARYIEVSPALVLQ